MKQRSSPLLKCLTVVAVLCFGVAHAARADNTYSTSTTVYYVGPSSDGAGCDNPFGICAASTNNSISSFNGGITSAGSTESITFDAVTSADVGSTPAVSITGGDMTILLYGYGNAYPGSGTFGTAPSGIVNGSNQLVAGTYTFSACTPNVGDYFGINDDKSGTESAPDCSQPYPYPNCLADTGGPSGDDQLCIQGDSPTDSVSINVSASGIVTITAGSFEAAFSETPELPSLVLFGTGLLAMGFALRRKASSIV